MSDENSREDSLEKFFQKKAGDYQIPFNEEDWKDLEKRLDMVDKQHASRKRQQWIAAASLLLFSLLAYFTYDNYTKINQISQLLNEETLPAEQREGNPPDERLNSNGSVPEKDADRENNSLPSYPGEDATLTQQNPDHDPEVIEESGGNAERFPIAENAGENLLVRDLDCSACTLSPVTPGSEEKGLVQYRLPGQGSGGSVLAAADVSLPSAFGESADRINRRPDTRFTAGLVVTPDLSTTGSVSNFSDPGYKIGVTLEYRLTSRLAVTTGILQSDVRYTAKSSDYRPPTGFWSGSAPYKTVAECILLDIPVNIKYNFMEFKRSGFYATAGLSSYIMLNEDYRFHYTGEEYGRVRDWSERTGTRHWISNAGFSLGYKLDVASGWSMRVEPYIKIPLREVGWGNVKLYSMGSFVSINYTFK